MAQSGELSFSLLKIAESEKLLNKGILATDLADHIWLNAHSPMLCWLMNAKSCPDAKKIKSPAPIQDVPQHPILIVTLGVLDKSLHAPYIKGRQFSVMDSNQPDAPDFIEQYGHHFLDADVTPVENLRARVLNIASC